MKKFALGIISALALLSTSCIKEFEDTIDELSSIKGVTTNPTMAAPLINASITLRDLLDDLSEDDDVFTTTNAEGKLSLKFFSRDSVEEKQYLILPNINSSIDAIMPPSEVPNFEATGKFSQTISNDLNITVSGNQRVERVIVKQGTFSFNIGSNFKHNTTVKISYPSITKNGVPFIDSFVFLYNGTTPANIIRNVDLSGYEIDFTKNGTTYNVFSYQIGVDITRNPSNNVSLTDKVSIVQGINVTQYKRIEGYFGKFDIAELTQSDKLGLFDKKLEGNVFIENPSLTLKLINSFGLPVTARVLEIYVVSGSGVKTPVVINAFKDTFALEYTSSIGQSKVTEYIIDKTNSNIDDVLNTAPQNIYYKVLFTANIDDIPKLNVLYDNTTVKQESTLDLPVDIKILNYAIESDGDFGLGETISDLDSNGVTVNWAEVVSEIVNGLPLNASVQVYIDDSTTNTLVDSIFKPAYLMTAATVNAQGEVIQPTKVNITNTINRIQYENLKRGNKYRLQVRLTTPESSPGNLPFVGIYDYQKINVKIGARTNLTYRSK
jgi:hypothetical protein